MIKEKTIWLVVAALLVAITASSIFAGCSSKAQEPFKDSPRSGTDNGPAFVVEMPDGFTNVAGKCLKVDGKNVGVLLLSGFHGDDNRMSITAVDSDYCR